MESIFNILLIVIALIFLALEYIYPANIAATDAISERFKMQHAYRSCDRCGIVEDKHQVVIRSSGYCSISCEEDWW